MPPIPHDDSAPPANGENKPSGETSPPQRLRSYFKDPANEWILLSSLLLIFGGPLASQPYFPLWLKVLWILVAILLLGLWCRAAYRALKHYLF